MDAACSLPICCYVMQGGVTVSLSASSANPVTSGTLFALTVNMVNDYPLAVSNVVFGIVGGPPGSFYIKAQSLPSGVSVVLDAASDEANTRYLVSAATVAASSTLSFAVSVTIGYPGTLRVTSAVPAGASPSLLANNEVAVVEVPSFSTSLTVVRAPVNI